MREKKKNENLAKKQEKTMKIALFVSAAIIAVAFAMPADLTDDQIVQSKFQEFIHKHGKVND
jgi:hypothetical protein